MSVVMYHYIRNYSKKLPNLNYLSKNIFLNQLTFFRLNGGITKNIDNYFKNKKNFLLTFDDGLKDHFFAFKNLLENREKGIFFIPSEPYLNDLTLRVHKTHILIGMFGGRIILKKLFEFFKKKQKSIKKKKEFLKIYSNQSDSDSTKECKKFLNYYLNNEEKDEFFKYISQTKKIKLDNLNFYLTTDQIKIMAKSGMEIGCHTNSHTVLSKLSYNEQKKDILQSKEFIEDLTEKKCKYFSIPYGSYNTFNIDTIKIIKKYFDNAFISYQEKNLITNKIISRIDCNKFI